MMPPTIGDYYRSAVEGVKKEIEGTPDDRAIGMNQEDWIAYLERKWGMAPIVLDQTREIGMSEVENEYVQRGYDIYTDREPGTRVRSVAVRIEVPVEPSDTLETIWKHKLAPNTFSISHGYPPFELTTTWVC